MISTTKKEMTFSKLGLVIPMGTRLEVFFVADKPQCVYFNYGEGKPKRVSLERASKYLTGFNPPPSLNTLEKWVSDGVAKTPTGQRVEPDGFGPDGSPSWLIVMGVI